ncbi:MAG TPA: rhomboid family intramembrane serine protease [Thermoanaerobaculia bacterium]
MIPLRQTIPSKTLPVVNRVIVGANVVMFFVQLFMGSAAERLIETFGFIPLRLHHPELYSYTRWEVAITLVTSLFLHGGFVHLFGNMIYLWVFGDAIEDVFGHVGYFFFFIAAGVIGSVTHTIVFPGSPIASIGASGSIAGVLGAFLVLRPHARIITLFPLVVYWAMAEVRAALFLPVWFLMQFFNGALALAAAHSTQEVVGIAWWAHIGGFIFGVIVAASVRVTRRSSE